jgi:hypothetical protein
MVNLIHNSNSQSSEYRKIKVINYGLCLADIWRSGGIAPPFLTSALDGDEWMTLRRERS